MNPSFACVDVEREGRCGRAETIFCEGKTPAEVVEIAGRLLESGQHVLGTRAGIEHFQAIATRYPEAVWHARARCVTIGQAAPSVSRWAVAIVAAGTSDLPVSEEAATTLEAFGQRVLRITDVGVAGLHRLLAEVEAIRECGVVIVVAGMEGALPSVVAGLVNRPVIAVPTSVGYGASFGGMAALLGMLTSCASKVCVVNIDNGFGAACAADAILRLSSEASP